jgi:hypothetical protein
MWRGSSVSSWCHLVVRDEATMAKKKREIFSEARDMPDTEFRAVSRCDESGVLIPG